MIAARRAAVIATSVAVALTTFAPGALADEVDSLLESARDATYNASRLTVSVWGDQTQVLDQWVEHWSEGELVRTNSTWSVYGSGRAMMMGDSPQGFAFVTPRPLPESKRYVIGDVDEVTHLGRPCDRVEILEGDGTRRATFLMDRRTGAMLHAEFYTDDGRIFRTVALADFKPYRVYPDNDVPSSVPLEVVVGSANAELPEELSGYALVDVFPGPGNSEQGFYSDGLFSFSLFAIDKGTYVSGFEEASAWVTDGGVYDMIPTAQDVRMQWSDGRQNYVLVGDLPPDHVSDVLVELPRPDTAGMFVRWWHRLFG